MLQPELDELMAEFDSTSLYKTRRNFILPCAGAVQTPGGEHSRAGVPPALVSPSGTGCLLLQPAKGRGERWRVSGAAWHQFFPSLQFLIWDFSPWLKTGTCQLELCCEPWAPAEPRAFPHWGVPFRDVQIAFQPALFNPWFALVHISSLNGYLWWCAARSIGNSCSSVIIF